jgi:hypothetical protein
VNEPAPDEYTSRAAFRYALLLAGKTPAEADKITASAWRRFQEQVRQSHPSEYPSREAYLTTMIRAEFEVPEIDKWMADADRRWREQQARDEQERSAREQYEREVEREEQRMEVTYDLLARRYRLEEDGDAALALDPAYAARRLAQVRSFYAGPDAGGTYQEATMLSDPLFAGVDGDRRPLR